MQESRLVPIKQGQEFRGIKAVARCVIGFWRYLGKPVPGADQLAVITSVYTIAKQRPEFQGNTTLEFDG